jgi:hypothetical protein
MKTVQDWGFISKDQGLVKPKLQDNKIFHALTSAYENNQQHEIYGATENIIRREKELCELALSDLKRLSEGKGEGDATLKLVMDHYQARLQVARDKQEKINQLSEDSRKMTEEYKKKTQELADVKRSLMDSQSKLRELAKTTEKLLKREEELRFIESNLRTELDKNKRNIINGLYEIVADLPEAGAPPVPPEAGEAVAPPAKEISPLAESFGSALFPAVATSSGPDKGETVLAPVESVAPEPPPVAKAPAAENSWMRREPAAPDPGPATRPAAPGPGTQQAPIFLKPGDLLEKAVRLKMFEPGKTLCSKSLVKTAEGEVISEYFYSPNQTKETRHYIFNTLYALSSLLNLKNKDEDLFQDRLETLFTDLLSRLEHSRNIHLESFLGEELNKTVIDKLLGLDRRERPSYFELLATRILGRIEGVGQARAGLIEQQFRQLPKAGFPPGAGIAA